jgi:diaminopimelate decarboxylase
MKTRGSPLLLFSEMRLRDNARTLRAAFGKHFDRLSVCYASKACSLLSVLKIFREEGLCLEVNSGGEIQRGRLAGFQPEAMVLNGVAKNRAELELALSPPIKAINVDSLVELRRILETAAAMGVAARIALRTVPELESGTTPGTETASSLTKFGMTSPEINACLELIRDNRERLRLAGMHVHVGSQICSLDTYRRAAGFLADMARLAEQTTGQSLEHVNAGGGFPLSYLKYPERSAPSYLHTDLQLADVAEAIAGPLRDRLAPDMELVIEPGRWAVGAAAVLLTTVENLKPREKEHWLYVDAGYHTLLDAFSYHWYYHCINASRPDTDETALFRLVGPLCDNGDSFYDVDGEALMRRLLAAEPGLLQFRELLEANLVRLPPYRELPADTAPGDVLAFLDVGAYATDQVFGMNGRGRPEVALVGADGRVRTLRTADSFEDQLLNETRR